MGAGAFCCTMDALGGNCYEYVRRFSEWRYELKLSYHTVVRETWWLHIDDPAIELKYFLKGEAVSSYKEGLVIEYCTFHQNSR